MKNNKTWAEEVAELIKDSGLKMTEISERLGIPYRTLQDWKAGKRNPDNFTKMAFRRYVSELKE